MSEQYTIEPACSRTQSLLTDYIDNTLSARDVWDVEKHLADCASCTELLQLTQSTVTLLRSAQSLDTSDAFMARLHSRLDEVGAVPVRRSFTAVLRDLAWALKDQIRVRAIPTVSLGLATCCVAGLLIFVRPSVPTVVPGTAAIEHVSQEALDRHVAVTASNPFDDPIAAKLEADSTEAGTRSGTD